MARILVTGGAGFIGANFVKSWLENQNAPEVVVLDKFTYAGNPDSLADLASNPRFTLRTGDIADRACVREILETFEIQKIVHFAAESHVDRSIDGPEVFVQTNVMGTFRLLDEALRYYRALDEDGREAFRFLHVSTDEVYGSLGETGKFHETTPYDPRSPYSASKAASDLFVNAYFHTFGLPVLTTNCSNNYGPFQFPEKLIPLMILNCLEGKPLPVYGDGKNVRDWLYVGDHCSAIRRVLERGVPGESYNIGGNCELMNIEIVRKIGQLVTRLAPEYGVSLPIANCEELITYVQDRPGHDRRYAMDISKIERELDWHPAVDFETGMERTVRWYFENRVWCERITQGVYQRQRLGSGS